MPAARPATPARAATREDGPQDGKGDGTVRYAMDGAGRQGPMEQRAVSPETMAAQALGEVDPASGGPVPVINPHGRALLPRAR